MSAKLMWCFEEKIALMSCTLSTNRPENILRSKLAFFSSFWWVYKRECVPHRSLYILYTRYQGDLCVASVCLSGRRAACYPASDHWGTNMTPPPGVRVDNAICQSSGPDKSSRSLAERAGVMWYTPSRVTHTHKQTNIHTHTHIPRSQIYSQSPGCLFRCPGVFLFAFFYPQATKKYVGGRV